VSLSATHRLVAGDLLRQRALTALLHRLNAAGVDVIVIKGAALAYVVYEQPHLRERCDADLLIRPQQLETADRVLLACGYQRQPEPNAEIASAQRHYRPPVAAADPIDLHWRAANPRVFEAILPFEDVSRRSIDVPALGPAARTLSHADALLLACVHRVAHHNDSLDERWLQDIDLLVQRLDPAEARSFVHEANRTRTRTVCIRSLELAHRHWGTPVEGLLDGLTANDQPKEPSAAFLGGRSTLAGILASDLRHAAWRHRVPLLRDHLFPSRHYMRAKYPKWPLALLPLAYAFRIVRGAPSWFKRPGTLGEAAASSAKP
jgi:hypothetical protein